MTASIEVTTRYATCVDDLTAAWSFVMDRLDRVGPDPRVHIEPRWEPHDDPDHHRRYFEVTVDGTVEEGR